tara:strand:+ start:629 stop:793 length:165 start_codon:yes stop_codon:yes gene_type:complete
MEVVFKEYLHYLQIVENVKVSIHLIMEVVFKDTRGKLAKAKDYCFNPSDYGSGI